MKCERCGVSTKGYNLLGGAAFLLSLLGQEQAIDLLNVGQEAVSAWLALPSRVHRDQWI